MNKTAEEILKEYYNHYKNVVFPEKKWVEWQDSADYGTVAMVLAAMESYASSLSSEVERLRRLVEDAYIKGRNDEKGVSETIGWEQFKRSHNL